MWVWFQAINLAYVVDFSGDVIIHLHLRTFSFETCEPKIIFLLLRSSRTLDMHPVPLLVGMERFSTECRKTKTKPFTYQVDYSANLKPKLINVETARIYEPKFLLLFVWIAVLIVINYYVVFLKKRRHFLQFSTKTYNKEHYWRP